MRLIMTKKTGDGGYIGETDGVKWSIYPNRATDLPDKVAEKLLADYPEEFVKLAEGQESIGESIAAAKDAELNELRAELAKLRKASVDKADSESDASKPVKATKAAKNA